MTHYKSINVKCLDSRFDEIKLAKRSNMEVILRLLSNRLFIMKLIFHIIIYIIIIINR